MVDDLVVPMVVTMVDAKVVDLVALKSTWLKSISKIMKCNGRPTG